MNDNSIQLLLIGSMFICQYTIDIKHKNPKYYSISFFNLYYIHINSL